MSKCIKKTMRRTHIHILILYSRCRDTNPQSTQWLDYVVYRCFVGEVQSPIEYYLTGNMKESIRQTHLLLLWVLLGNNEYNCIKLRSVEIVSCCSGGNLLHDDISAGAEDLHEAPDLQIPGHQPRPQPPGRHGSGVWPCSQWRLQFLVKAF